MRGVAVYLPRTKTGRRQAVRIDSPELAELVVAWRTASERASARRLFPPAASLRVSLNRALQVLGAGGPAWETRGFTSCGIRSVMAERPGRIWRGATCRRSFFAAVGRRRVPLGTTCRPAAKCCLRSRCRRRSLHSHPGSRGSASLRSSLLICLSACGRRPASATPSCLLVAGTASCCSCITCAL